jgi:hypothetical protein
MYVVDVDDQEARDGYEHLADVDCTAVYGRVNRLLERRMN